MMTKFPKSAGLYLGFIATLEEEKKELEDKISAGSPDQNLLNLAISEVEAAFEKANSTILNIINCEKIE
jgi:hypothetical protein